MKPQDDYDKILQAIPRWKPTRKVPVFGISAIQEILGCSFRDALDMKERLEYESGLPKRTWRDEV